MPKRPSNPVKEKIKAWRDKRTAEEDRALAAQASTDDEMMTWSEAVAHLMKATGKNRRQATADLLQTVRKGKIPVTGINRKTGEREVIPPDQFPVVN